MKRRSELVRRNDLRTRNGTDAEPILRRMSEGAYALVGVVIEGTLNGAVAWLLGRLRLREDAKVAALLVVEELLRSSVHLLALPETKKWAGLREAGFGAAAHWHAHRVVLGRVLSPAG